MIHFHYLVAAQWAYKELGYTPIDVPWWATRDIVNITKPIGLPEHSEYELSINNKCLLASGEQGFLYMANKGQLPSGNYQTITPCFRNEPHDTFHQKQFMKLELMEYMDTHTPWHATPDAAALNERIECMVDNVLDTFDVLAQNQMVIRAVTVDTPDHARVPGTVAYDIEGKYNDQWIELGSYGARRSVFGTWIFGTGLAEPRFSKVLHAAQL